MVLTEYFQEIFSKPPRIAYFGSHILNDIQATHDLNKVLKETEASKAKWHPIAVVEEFDMLDSSFSQGVSPDLVPFDQKIWGGGGLWQPKHCPRYFFDEVYTFVFPNSKQLIPSGGTNRNFFITELSKAARYALPFLKNMDAMIQDEQPSAISSKLGLEKPQNLVLHVSFMSPASRAVLLFCRLNAIDFEVKEYSMIKDEVNSTFYLKNVNPMGQVPVLQEVDPDSGKVLFTLIESPAILKYLMTRGGKNDIPRHWYPFHN